MRTKTLHLLWAPALLAALSAGCGSDDGDDELDADAGPEEVTVEYLSPTEHLVRASMAIRGTRPTLEDLRAVDADPALLPDLVDDYLDDPEFGATIRDLHNDQMLMRVDIFFFAPVGFLSSPAYTAAQVNRSIFESPLKLIEYVVMNDRPYTEIVTADYTVADDIVAGVWGLDYDDTGAEWQQTAWTDGRPAAGILSSSSLFARHQSAGFNYNRGRANMLSTALLCSDFLDRDGVIDGSVNLSDPDVVADAVTQVAECAGCHQALDPLASYLWGYRQFIVPSFQTTYPVQHYAPANETRWQDTSRRPPGFFGDVGGDLSDLGDKIAADPRFAQCAAKRFFAYMAQVDVADVPFEVVAELQEELVASGYDAKALAKAVVLHDAFRVSHSTDPDEAETLVGFKKARPEQLARMMRDLTGFVWETDLGFTIGDTGQLFGPVELPTSDLLGFRTLAGGIDSYFVTRPTRTVNVTASLFLQAFAAEAAGFVVENDFDVAPDGRRLLRQVEDDTTSEGAIRAQLADLHLRIYGEVVDPDSAEVTASYDLWAATYDRTATVTHAWKTVLTAMLQDLQVAYY